VEIKANGDLATTEIETGLCLYRIAQEALRNIAKHAGACHVCVTVRQVDDEVELAVADDGKGFDLTKIREQGGGLGLRSIEERVRLVGGRLAIETSPSTGTRITVCVNAAVPIGRAAAGM
jgi:signal transduction histidine kinase